MMNIWLAADIERVALQDALNTRLLTEKIYEKYKEATSLDINFKAKASSEIEFLEFEVERGYQYLERGLVKAGLDICKLLSSQDRLYYNDLMYSITCEIARKLQSPSEEKYAELCSILVNYSAERIPITDILHSLEEILLCEESSSQYKIIKNLKFNRKDH